LQEGSVKETVLCQDLKKVVEIIVGLLIDRVGLEKEPKRQRVEV